MTIDMNGLKEINDKQGHTAGDKALETLAFCFMQATASKDSVYRLGGDEFVIVCRKESETDVLSLIERIQGKVSETSYSCAIGYSYRPNGPKNIDDMTKESDEMMYKNKMEFYSKPGNKRYRG